MSDQRFTVTISNLDAKGLGTVLAALPSDPVAIYQPRPAASHPVVVVEDTTQTWGSARKAVLRHVMGNEGPQERTRIIAWALMFGGFVGPVQMLEDAFNTLHDEGEIIDNGSGYYALKGFDFDAPKTVEAAPAA